eukprot:gene22052-16_t
MIEFLLPPFLVALCLFVRPFRRDAWFFVWTLLSGGLLLWRPEPYDRLSPPPSHDHPPTYPFPTLLVSFPMSVEDLRRRHRIPQNVRVLLRCPVKGVHNVSDDVLLPAGGFLFLVCSLEGGGGKKKKGGTGQTDLTPAQKKAARGGSRKTALYCCMCSKRCVSPDIPGSGSYAKQDLPLVVRLSLSGETVCHGCLVNHTVTSESSDSWGGRYTYCAANNFNCQRKNKPGPKPTKGERLRLGGAFTTQFDKARRPSPTARTQDMIDHLEVPSWAAEGRHYLSQHMNLMDLTKTCTLFTESMLLLPFAVARWTQRTTCTLWAESIAKDFCTGTRCSVKVAPIMVYTPPARAAAAIKSSAARTTSPKSVSRKRDDNDNNNGNNCKVRRVSFPGASDASPEALTPTKQLFSNTRSSMSTTKASRSLSVVNHAIEHNVTPTTNRKIMRACGESLEQMTPTNLPSKTELADSLGWPKSTFCRVTQVVDQRVDGSGERASDLEHAFFSDFHSKVYEFLCDECPQSTSRRFVHVPGFPEKQPIFWMTRGKEEMAILALRSLGLTSYSVRHAMRCIGCNFLRKRKGYDGMCPTCDDMYSIVAAVNSKRNCECSDMKIPPTLCRKLTNKCISLTCSECLKRNFQTCHKCRKSKAKVVYTKNQTIRKRRGETADSQEEYVSVPLPEGLTSGQKKEMFFNKPVAVPHTAKISELIEGPEWEKKLAEFQEHMRLKNKQVYILQTATETL